jgi:AraC-like DNA-binding protein
MNESAPSVRQVSQHMDHLAGLARRINEEDQVIMRKIIRDLWKGSFWAFRRTYLVAELVGIYSSAELLRDHDSSRCNPSSAFPGTACDHILKADIYHALLSRACSISQVVDHAISRGYQIESFNLIRSMYETLLSALMLEKDGTHVLAARYHDLAAIKEFRYQENRSQWQEAPEWFERDKEDERQVREYRERALSHWKWRKKSFGDYEWARPCVRAGESERINLQHMASAVGMGHRKYLYRILSESVHVSPLDVLSQWHMQSSAGRGFVPAAHENAILSAVPEVLVAATKMTAEITSVVAKFHNSCTNDSRTIWLSELIDRLSEVLDVLVADNYRKSRQYFDRDGAATKTAQD